MHLLCFAHQLHLFVYWACKGLFSRLFEDKSYNFVQNLPDDDTVTVGRNMRGEKCVGETTMEINRAFLLTCSDDGASVGFCVQFVDIMTGCTSLRSVVTLMGEYSL
jgi:hypothetical protein